MARTSASKSKAKTESQKNESHVESKAERYAKRIDSPEQHEDYAGQTLVTHSHEVIRHWAEERNAKPATIRGTEHEDHLGVLRMNFPGYDEDGKLEEVSWDEWVRTFDARNLEFVFQEHRSDGKMSNFFRLDNPSREDA
jgi:hypothetical protein